MPDEGQPAKDNVQQTSKIIVICAQQRSGTTALRHALGRTSTIEDKGEIFHPDGKDNKSNFFHFLRLHQDHAKLLWYKTEENCRSVSNKYFEYLLNLKTKKNIMLDIKYNSWNHLDQVWHSPLEPPFLLTDLKKKGAIIIHITRQNLLLQHLSLKYADANKKYHYEDRSPNSLESLQYLKVNVKECVNRLTLNRATQNLFTSFMAGYACALQLTYENLYDGRRIADDPTKRLKALINFQESELETDLAKTPVHMSDVITNKVELASALIETPFEPMISEALGVDVRAMDQIEKSANPTS